MNSSNPSDDIASEIEVHIQKCLSQLSAFQSVIKGKQWDKLEQQMQAYDRQVQLLRLTSDANQPLPDTCESMFYNLERQHRKTARLLHVNMALILEDINIIEEGSKKLEHILNFTARK